MSPVSLFLLPFLLFGLTTAALAQPVSQQDLDALRAELTRLRAEVEALKQALGSAAQPASAAPDLAPQVAVLQSQVQELAQTKVESTSRLPVKLFGSIVSNTFVNSGEANWLENPNLVGPTPGPAGHSGSFSSTLRQTRIGAAIDGPTVGAFRASGVLAMDFFGGVPNFKTGQVMGLPRLLYAFARLDGSKTAFEFGQDQMILAPRDPTSLAAQSFPSLFRSGNLYLRVPQARVEQQLGRGLSLVAGIVAPIAGDFSEDAYVFVPPAGAGERSRVPAVQSRLGWRRGATEADAPHVDLGLSGHYGRERFGADTDASWAGAVDFDLQGARVGVGGEFYYGENIDQFGGSLAQRAKSAGGFAEARVRLSRRVAVNGGAGFDRLPDHQFITLPRRENRSAFGNVIIHVTPEVATSIEYRWLSTLFLDEVRRQNHHVNWVMAYSF